MNTPENPLYEQLKRLETEQRNPETMQIDLADAGEIARLMNDQDKGVALVIEQKLDVIAKAIDLVSDAFRVDGRLLYAGAGTSGRLGVLDASECPPTFGTDPSQVVGLIAGGKEAMFEAQEGAEDSPDNGAADIAKLKAGNKDVICGLAASGRTPYVHGALGEGKKRGSKTILVCCVDAGQVNIDIEPDIIIDIPVGPEVIMGSTRLKSATAQKMVCNMITTGAMIRLGKVYENVMVDLMLTNKKLVERSRRIVMMFTKLTYEEASDLLDKAKGHVKVALLMHMGSLSREEAINQLQIHKGFIRSALQAFE